MMKSRATKIATLVALTVLGSVYATVGASAQGAGTNCPTPPAGMNVIISDAPVITGTGGNDFICAGPSANQIIAKGGADIIYGGDGNDDIRAQGGADTVYAGNGDDKVAAGGGNDMVDGGSGNDSLFGGDNRDTLLGQAGNDRIVGNDGKDNLNGGSGADAIHGGFGHDTLNGGTGNDRLSGNSGNDTIEGQDGVDRASGGSGNDSCFTSETFIRCESSPDADGDGFMIGSGDCDDNNPAIFPGALEIMDDGIDQDCTGADLMNQSPVILNNAFLVDENVSDGTPVGDTEATDVEDGSALTYTITAGDVDDIFEIDSTGILRVAHAPGTDFERLDQYILSVLVTDSGGLTDTATIVVTVADINEAPTAADTSVTLDEDGEYTFVASDFNFDDVDTGDTLVKIQVVALPGAGALEANGSAVGINQDIPVEDIDNGGLVFIPAANGNGSPYATFDFKVHDGITYSDGASYTASITVAPINDTPEVLTTGGTTEFIEDDGPVVVDAGVTASDIEDDPWTAATITITNLMDGDDEVLAATPSGGIEAGDISYVGGVLTITGPAAIADVQAVMQSVTYENSNDAPDLTDRVISFVVADGAELSPLATKTVTITETNDAPSVELSESALAGYTENDGPLVVDSGATITELDSTFMFGLTVEITLGADVADELACPGCAAEGIVAGFGANKLSLAGAASPAAYESALQSITFENTSDNPSEDDRELTVTANDGLLLSDPVSMDFGFTVVNDAPTAVDDDFDVDEGGTLGDVVDGNDTDPEDGTPLGVINVLSTPVNADTFTWDPSGSFTYVHDGSETTTDSFTYSIEDGDGEVSNTGTVNITINPVNDAPVAEEDAYSVDEGATLTTTAGADGAVDNDTDAEDITPAGDAAIVTGPANAASFTLNADGSFSYEHDGSETTTDSFTYNVLDADGEISNDATVTITINPVNDAPEIAPSAGDTAFVEDAGAVVVDAAVTAVDAEGDDVVSATVTITNLLDGADESLAATPAGAIGAGDISYAAGVLTITGPAPAADVQSVLQSVTYDNASDTPDETDRSIDFEATDGTDASAPVTKTVTVEAANDAPEVVISGAPLAAYTEGDGAVAIDTGATLVEPDSPSIVGMTIEITDGADVGDTLACPDCAGEGIFAGFSGNVLTLAGTEAPAAYEAALQSITFNNTDDNPSEAVRELTITANDGFAGSTPVTIDFTFSAVNDDPTAVADDFEVDEAGTVSGNVVTNDTDPEDGTPTGVVTLVSGPANDASFTLNPDGSFTYVHDGSETVGDSFTYMVTDSEGASSGSGIVTVTINPVNDAPVAEDDAYSVDEGATLTTTAGADGAVDNDTDAEDITPAGDAAIVTGPANAASFTLNADGSFSYEHDGSETTTDSFTYNVLDADGEISNDATVTITINPVNDTPVAEDDAHSVDEGGTLAGTTVVANDTDAEDTIPSGDAAVVTAPVNATAFTLNTDGTFSYEHDDSETTSDSFTYTVLDSDGGLSNEATVTITINPINDEIPEITSDGGGDNAGVDVDENQTGATDVDSSDADGESEAGGGLTYALTTTAGGGVDNGFFAIDADSGVLTFNAAPNFEAPADNDTNNNYEVQVTVTDGNAQTDTQDITVTVLGVNDAPTIDSDGGGDTAAHSQDENTTPEITDVESSDEDGSTELSGSLTYAFTTNDGGGADNALFSIGSADGKLSFTAQPNFELPGDADTDNDYEVQVTVTDAGGLTDTQDITVTVDDVNEMPMITTSNAFSADENQTAVDDIDSYDDDTDDSELLATLTYSLTAGGAGDDNAFFRVDGTTGVLTFLVEPNFEDNSDANGDNDYIVEVEVSDGALSSTQIITVTLNDVNDAPEITSPNADSMDENNTLATDVDSFDEDGDTEGAGGLVYSITGGDDGALFDIDANGDLSFFIAPDFDIAGDFDADNDYEVQVTVTDSGAPGVSTLSDSLDITITVNDINETPIITSSATPTVDENQTVAVDVETDDQEDSEGAGLTYAITAGADQALFGIDTSTGALDFLAAPDWENPTDVGANNVYNVEVTVTDSGTLTAVQNIAVTVVNVNETPTIESAATASAAENQTVVMDILSSDLDGELESGGGLTYAFTTDAAGADNDLFTLDADTGELTFTAAPDFEAERSNVYDVEVTVSDAGVDGPVLTDTQNILVTVTDVNEVPEIQNADASVEENQTVGTNVETIDDQSDEGAGLTYAFSTVAAGGPDNGLFSLDANTGQIDFLVAPDFETPGDSGGDNVYDVQVTVTDDGVPVLDDVENIQITVTDVNEDPTITTDSAQTAAENQSAVVDLSATDLDGETEGAGLTYAVTGGADQLLFGLNTATGVVSFLADPDFEAPADAGANNVYDLQVTVSDAGDPALTDVIDLVITVTNVNEDPSITSDAVADVDENTTAVIDVESSDLDNESEAGGGLTYSITGGADMTRFNIDTDSGELAFNSARNFESPVDAVGNGPAGDNVYEVQVTVTDAGVDGPALTDVQDLEVTVIDVNEAPRIDNPNPVEIDENETDVIDLDATDPDGELENGFGLTYGFTNVSGNGEDNALFDLDTATGVVTFKVAPSFEAPADVDTDNTYRAQVTVTDAGGLTYDRNLNIKIQDVDEDPIITTADAVDAPENQTAVIDIQSTDDDGDVEGAAGLTYAFSTTLDGEDNGSFTLDANTGVLTFTAAPDFDIPGDVSAPDNDYEVEVTVTDSDGLTDVQEITVSVTNVNETPSIDSGATNTVDENQTSAIDVDSSDPDGEAENSGLTYTITGGPDAGLFGVDADTGEVSFLAAPNFEAPGDAGGDNIYNLTVRVNDVGGLTDTQDLIITVKDINDAPVFTTDPAASMPEDLMAALDVDSTDEDGDSEGLGLTYALTTTAGGGDDNGFVTVNVNTGEIIFTSAPNFEAPADANGDNDYEVQVTVSDSGAPTATVESDVIDVTITVTNVNDAPVITSDGGLATAALSVDENLTAVTDVESSDDDLETEGAGLTYSKTGGADQALFALDANTGVLTFIAAPDFETPLDAGGDNDYEVQVTVTDVALTTDVQDITVTVDDVNENPVISTADTASVAENTTAVVDIDSTDVEGDTEGAGLTYSFGLAADNGAFTIGSTDGVLAFTSAPDFDVAGDADGNNDYQVQVIVTDTGGLTDTLDLTVSVTNVNEDPSITSAAAAAVDENQTDAISVESTDVDGETDNGGGLTYSKSGGADTALFALDANTGALTFISAPDFETPLDVVGVGAAGDNDYEVQVTVTDAGGLTDVQDIVITVDDVNENPVISTADTASVAENQTAVVDIDATDVDAGQTATLVYSKTGGADEAAFSLDPGTGVLTFTSAPDFDIAGDADGFNDYEVQVTVTDSGSLTDVLDLTVTLTNVNEGPSIDSGATASVEENQTDAIDVSSSDPDGDDAEGSGLTYAFSTDVGGTDNGSFSINSGTGVVTFTAAPDFDIAGDDDLDNDYEVEVTVTDGEFSDTQQITITLTNVNENPVISTGTAVSVNEEQPAVVDVDATDVDAGQTATLVYSLATGGDNDLFDIDSGSGVITFMASPDYEVPGDVNGDNDYEIEVTVTDAGAPGLTDVLNLTVTVDPVNEETPAIAGLDNAPAHVEDGVAVVFDVDVSVSDFENDQLNAGAGNYDGSTLTLGRNGGINAGDTFGGSGTLLALVEAGDITVGASPTVIGTVTTNSGGTLVLSFNGSATTALVAEAMQQITYSTTNDAPAGSVTIDFTFDDGEFNTTEGIAVAISPTNDAPTMVAANPALAGTDVDVTSSATLVSSLISSSTIEDGDAGAFDGIIVTGSTGLGTWQYTIDGTNWLAMATVSDGAARALEPGAQIRYIPDPAVGETATISYRGWDRTDGSTNGQGSIVATTNGGATAYGADTDTADLVVSEILD